MNAAFSSRLMRVLHHSWLQMACRLILGAIFIYAAYPKIVDPPAFAKAIYTYKLFPAWTIHPFALFLPWLEMLCGVLIIVGFWVRASAAWMFTLLCAFVLALSINLARKHPVDCGCFGETAAVKTHEEKMRDIKIYIVRDLGMILLCLILLAPMLVEDDKTKV